MFVNSCGHKHYICTFNAFSIVEIPATSTVLLLPEYFNHTLKLKQFCVRNK